MRKTSLPRVFVFLAVVSNQLLNAQLSREVCPRPAVGSVVAEPEDLRSRNGVLEAELTANSAANPMVRFATVIPMRRDVNRQICG